MENEQLVWQALLAKEIWMCSMVLLMGDLEEGRQQRSEAMTVNGCEVDAKCEWQQDESHRLGADLGQVAQNFHHLV